MSAVKRKLRNKSLKQECEIIRHIKKGMTKKEASKNFRVPKISFNVDEKQREMFLRTARNFIVHQKNMKM